MKQFKIPKEIVLPQLKKELPNAIAAEMKAKGVTGFKFIDMDWEEEGLIVYYEQSSKGPHKAKRK